MKKFNRYMIVQKLINSNGFTLIETVVVLIITGLLVAIALPNYNKTIGYYNLDNSARLLASDIRSIQQTAIKNESSNFNMLFNTANDRYYLRNGTTPYKTVNLPSSVRLVFVHGFMTPNNNKLELAANGIPYNRFGGHISLQDRKTGKFLYVVVDPVGRVRVSETAP
ncbi:MAG: type II secretion system protein [Desulfotomaculaceae bacterium]|nr:type II secretion system protein [Desulfotomaculaceae bacterium]